MSGALAWPTAGHAPGPAPASSAPAPVTSAEADIARARQALETELAERQDASGGFPYRRGGMAFTDATAWSLLALPARGTLTDSRRRARAFLDTCRRGAAFAATSGDPEPSWMTIPVTLSLLASDPKDAAGLAAARWLLDDYRAQSEPGKPAPGWPWTQGCAPWVEPTTLALVAAAHAGAADHERTREGLRLLVENQARGGGWSLYARHPHVYHTGLVLMALEALRNSSADPSKMREPSKNDLFAARAFLVSAAPESRAPLDLAVATLALIAKRDAAAAPLTRLLVTRVLSAPEKLDTLAAAVALIALRHAQGEPVLPQIVAGARR